MEVVTAVSAASATSNATAANAAPPIAAAAGAAAGQLRRKVLTLVFVRQGQQLLLGYKKRGFGAGRFNGFGGKVEAGETPRQGAARELLEESGLTAQELHLAGRLYFEFEEDPVLLDVHVFIATRWTGEPVESDEMRPEWFPVDKLPYDHMWLDDPHWLPSVLQGESVSFYGLFRGETVLLEKTLRAGFVDVEDFNVKWHASPPTVAIGPIG